jgi:hypothetical protein
LEQQKKQDNNWLERNNGQTFELIGTNHGARNTKL